MPPSIILGLPMAIIFVHLARVDEARDMRGGGASFESLAALMVSGPIYLVIFPLTYLLIARFVAATPTTAIPPTKHLVILIAFALGAFGLAMLAGSPNTFADPARGARESLVLVAIFTAQFAVYFEALEFFRLRC